MHSDPSLPSANQPYPFVGPPRPLRPAVLPEVLLRLAAHAAAAPDRRGVVVFDLDSTLLDNRPRQARIIREFGLANNLPQLLACSPADFAGWSLHTPLLSCGLTAEEATAREPALRQFWRQRFFTSEYCVDDIAMPGAVEFVAQVQQHGAQVVYCTGRPQPMWDGTVRCFAQLGLPLPDGQAVQLLMKTTADLHDDDFKRQVAPQLLAIGEVLAAFDNEPAHINSHQQNFPAALCVHLATDQSLRDIAVLPAIPSISDFVLP